MNLNYNFKILNFHKLTSHFHMSKAKSSRVPVTQVAAGATVVPSAAIELPPSQSQVNKKKAGIGKGNAQSATSAPTLTPGVPKRVGELRGNTSNKAGLQFGVPRVARFMKSGRFADRIGGGAPIYLASAMQYICSEILELAANEAKEAHKKRINPRHVMLAIRKDKELNKLLGANADFANTGVLPNIPGGAKAGKKGGKGGKGQCDVSNDNDDDDEEMDQA